MELPIKVRLQCRDIETFDEADVYCAGHYVGVGPQNAELALDRLVSGPGADDRPLVLTTLAQQNVLQGRFGEINLYPWAREVDRGKGRLVAIVGMGYPGTLSATRLRGLVRALTYQVAALPDVRTMCTVVIGAGTGAMPLADAVGALLMGVADALEDGMEGGLEELVIVENDVGRFHRLEQIVESIRARQSPAIPRLECGTSDAGRVSRGFGLALGLVRLARAVPTGDEADTETLERILGETPHRGGVIESLEWLAAEVDINHPHADERAASGLALETFSEPEGSPPTHVFFFRDDTERRGTTTAGGGTSSGPIRSGAVTSRATVPERHVHSDTALTLEVLRDFDALFSEKVAPEHHAPVLANLSKTLDSFFVHRDFKPLFSGELADHGPIVFTVDREMASIPWEALAGLPIRDQGHLALQRPVARQLKTSYGAPPRPPERRSARRRALVVGDPCDDLPRPDKRPRRSVSYCRSSATK